MSDAFTERLQRAVADGDPVATAAALAGATTQQRRAVAEGLRQAVKTSNSWATADGGGGTQMYYRAYDEATFMVAGAACLPTAAQVATWLCRRGFAIARPPADLIVDVLRERRVPWLAEVAQRVAAAPNRDNRLGRWQLSAALLVAAGVPAPATDDAVLGWLEDRFGYLASRRGGIREALRRDPFLDQFIGRVFEVDGAGALLEVTAHERRRPGFDAAEAGVQPLVALAAEGRLDRGMLLDGCLSRFLKGDRPRSLRAFVELHDTLTPTLAELAARVDDYGRLVPDAHSTVAALAQAALRRLDEAALLDRQTLLQAGRHVLFRSEKGLIRTQLAWLERVARRGPDDAGEVVEVIAVAFAHPALDIQVQALTIAARYAAQCDPTVHAVLAQAGRGLGADLPARAAALFGTQETQTQTPTVTPAPPALPVAVALRQMPRPIESPAELAAELTALLTNEPEPVAFERTLDALVRLHATDRHGLRVSLGPLVDRFRASVDYVGPVTVGLPSLLGGVLAVAAGANAGTGWPAPADAARLHGFAAPHLMLVWRLAEIAQHIGAQPVPFLVGTPTAATGHINPRVLVERLAAAQDQGWQPWPVDFTQALLRLPRSVQPDVLDTARSLTSPAGRTLAKWLAAGGPTDPAAEVDVLAVPHKWYGTDLTSHPVVRLSAPLPHPDQLVSRMLTYEPTEYDRWKVGDTQPLWPAVLPSHRDVVAANLLPQATVGRLFGRTPFDAVLPALAECTGPCGPATWLLIASALGSAHNDDRIAGVDATVGLATAGDLDGHALGRAIGHLVTGRDIKLTRVAPALVDIAAAVTGPAAWNTVTTLLSALLPEPKPPAGTPEVLTLAATLATSHSIDVPIAGLAETAARTGASRLVAEARRLHRMLSARATTGGKQER